MMFYIPSEKQKKIADFMRKYGTEIVIGRRMTYIIKKKETTNDK